MEYQLSYFKSWKMMLWKCYTQYASKIGKLSSGHRTGKEEFSFQSQRKAMSKNAQTTTQLHSSHILVKSCSKFSKPGFSEKWTVNFQVFKLKVREGRGTRNQIANIHWIIEKAREFQKNIYFCFIAFNYSHAKANDSVDHNKLWKILRDGNTRPPDLPLEKSVCRSGSNS